MDVCLELLFYFLFEFGLNIVSEFLTELSVRPISRSQKKPNHILAAFGYAILGAILGGASLLTFPRLFLQHPILRFINLIITPFLVGFARLGIARLFDRSKPWEFDLPLFTKSALFALLFSLVRLMLGK